VKLLGGSREKQNIPIGILPGGGITLTGPIAIGIPIGIIPGGGITLTGPITVGIPIVLSIPDGGRGVFAQR